MLVLILNQMLLVANGHFAPVDGSEIPKRTSYNNTFPGVDFRKNKEELPANTQGTSPPKSRKRNKIFFILVEILTAKKQKDRRAIFRLEGRCKLLR